MLQEIHRTLTDAHAMLSEVHKLGDERIVLGRSRIIIFAQRWHIYSHKLGLATKALSVHDFDGALHNALSMRHDFNAIKSLFEGAIKELKPTLSCFEEPTDPIIPILVVIIAVIVVVFLIIKVAQKYYRGKAKRY